MPKRNCLPDAQATLRHGRNAPVVGARAQPMSTTRRRAQPMLQLSLQFARFDDVAVHRAALPRQQVRRWLRRALAADAEITVRIVETEEARRLNREFRARDYATNVLTFDYAGAPLVLADLVLCAPVVAAEAAAAGRALQAHYAHLLVHGALHAQGWDHETGDADAERMEARETEVLRALGIADPYA